MKKIDSWMEDVPTRISAAALDLMELDLVETSSSEPLVESIEPKMPADKPFPAAVYGFHCCSNELLA